MNKHIYIYAYMYVYVYMYMYMLIWQLLVLYVASTRNHHHASYE